MSDLENHVVGRPSMTYNDPNSIDLDDDEDDLDPDNLDPDHGDREYEEYKDSVIESGAPWPPWRK